MLQDHPLPSSWCTLFEQSLKNGFGAVLGYLVVIINSATVGHADTNPQEQVAMLAGYGLAQAMQNVLHIGPAIGLVGALDTLVSQANGANQMKQCCIYLGQGRAILTLHWVLIAPLAWFSDSLLQFLGMDPLSAHFAGSFNRINIIGWWLRSQMYCSRRFLSNLNSPGANLWITGASLAQHVGILMSVRFQLPLEVLAWVTVATIATHSTLLMVHLVWNASGLRIERHDLIRSMFVFREWGLFLQLGIPGMLQSCSEFWAMEVFTIIAGYINTASLAACALIYNISAAGYLIGVGIGSATSGLVGEAIGSGHAKTARANASRFMAVAFMLWAPMACILLFGAWPVAALFSPQADIQNRLVPLLRLYAAILLVDCLNQVICGVLRAVGRPKLAAGAYLCFFYLVMLPLACILAFLLRLGVFGMYIGYMVASACVLLVLAVGLRRMRFETVCDQTRDGDIML